MSHKTYLEVKREVEEVQLEVPHYTMFNDDNWAAIGAQIDALRDDMSEDDVCDLYDSGDLTDHERDNALEAIAWRDGDYDEWEAEDGTVIDRPSMDWALLA